MATTARQQYFADESSIQKDSREFAIADDIQQKIDSIEEGAQVNTIETIRVNGTDVEPDQDKVVDITIPDVIDSLSSTSTTDALSAKQGKVLYDKIQNVESRGRFLSNWNCATGLPVTNPEEDPYVYAAGDYYTVSNVAASGGTNYRPDGTSYIRNHASITPETDAVAVSDFYLFDGTNWLLLTNSARQIAIDSSLSTTSTNPVENRVVTNALNDKANTTDVLTKTNTTNYTPTQNYNPATKKYVDDIKPTSGSTAPSTTPTFVGQQYVDTVADKMYVATGTSSSSDWMEVGAGSGDVVGPSSAIDGHIAVFDGTTGKLIKDGGAVPTGDEIVYATQAEYNALLPGAASDGKHYFIYSTGSGGTTEHVLLSLGGDTNEYNSLYLNGPACLDNASTYWQGNVTQVDSAGTYYIGFDNKKIVGFEVVGNCTNIEYDSFWFSLSPDNTFIGNGFTHSLSFGVTSNEYMGNPTGRVAVYEQVTSNTCLFTQDKNDSTTNVTITGTLTNGTWSIRFQTEAGQVWNTLVTPNSVNEDLYYVGFSVGRWYTGQAGNFLSAKVITENPGGSGWQPGAHTVLYAPFDSDLKDVVNNVPPTVTGTASIVNGVAELQWAQLLYPVASSPSNNRTICFWSKMTQFPYYNPRFMTGNGWTTDMYRRGDSGCAGMYWNQEQPDQRPVNQNEWAMWTWTQDGNTNILYKNGVAKAYNVQLPTSAAEVHIGNPGPDDGFYGYMSKFIVEDRTWTAQEVLAYYSQTSGDYQ